MKVIGYVRVSTAEQADSGAGLEAQRKAVQDACTARGWQLAGIYEDAATSGRKLRRPGLTAALGQVESGSAEALVVAKLDRLSRSLVDFTSLMERSRRNGWAVVALDLGVDTTTPAGEMMANTMANFAQFERRLIGERTRDALAVKRTQGVRLGRPRSLPVKVVADIKRRVRSGESLNAVARQLNDAGVPTAQGGRQWYPATVRKIALQAESNVHRA